MSSGEIEPTPLSEVQQRMLELIANRNARHALIHGFMLDALYNMHPLAVADYLDVEMDHLSERRKVRLAATDGKDAWLNSGYYTGPVVAPYKDPVVLMDNLRSDPVIDENLSPGEVIMSLAAKRLYLGRGVLPSGPVTSKELLEGYGEDVSVADAVTSWLVYQEQTVPNLVMDAAVILDPETERHKDEKLEILYPHDPDIIIAIPVADKQEHETLPQTLELLASQSLDHSRYEAVLLHNYRLPEDDYEAIISGDRDALAAIDTHFAEEHRWLSDVYSDLLRRHPNFRVRVFASLHRPGTKIGFVRNFIHQDIADRYLARGSTNNPLILNLDADVTSLNSDYLTNMLQIADRTQAPVIGSRLRWHDSDVTTRGSLIARLLKFERFLMTVTEDLSGKAAFMDCGTAMRLKEYCLAGGNFWDEKLVEVGKVALMIAQSSSFSGPFSKPIVISKNSVHGSHPRRQIDMMARGYNPSLAWNEKITTFGNEDDPVRVQTLPLRAAEKNAVNNLNIWLKEMIEAALGDEGDERFRIKRDSIRKGLQIIGLPNIYADNVVESSVS